MSTQSPKDAQTPGQQSQSTPDQKAQKPEGMTAILLWIGVIASIIILFLGLFAIVKGDNNLYTAIGFVLVVISTLSGILQLMPKAVENLRRSWQIGMRMIFAGCFLGALLLYLFPPPPPPPPPIPHTPTSSSVWDVNVNADVRTCSTHLFTRAFFGDDFLTFTASFKNTSDTIQVLSEASFSLQAQGSNTGITPYYKPGLQVVQPHTAVLLTLYFQIPISVQTFTLYILDPFNHVEPTSWTIRTQGAYVQYC